MRTVLQDLILPLLPRRMCQLGAALVEEGFSHKSIVQIFRYWFWPRMLPR